MDLRATPGVRMLCDPSFNLSTGFIAKGQIKFRFSFRWQALLLQSEAL